MNTNGLNRSGSDIVSVRVHSWLKALLSQCVLWLAGGRWVGMSEGSMPDLVTPDSRPHLVSLCGTYLKPEMQSIYRQLTGLTRVRNTVYVQWLENEAQFPYEPLVKLRKLHHRPRGNFLKRFYYKYIVRQWPPPVEINKFIGPCHPWDMVEQLQKDKPDIVHAYYGHKAVTYLGMLKEWGGPWVVSFHGVDVARDVDDPEHLKGLRTVFSEAELVMARSDSLLKRLEELGCPREKLRLNRTPIPLDHLKPSVRMPPQDGQWRIVQACRLIAKKGILTAIKAMQTVVKQYPEARYLICGTGPQEEKLRAAITSAGLEKNVQLLGWLSQEQLLAEYEKAHLFLHPSELTKDSDQEGIPNSMLEAMATGLPVVATLHGGIPEAVTDVKEGLLVPERSPDELAKALLTLMNSPEQLAECSQTAASSVREHFGAASQIASMEDVYLEAIARHAARKVSYPS
jgi:colanic acid/amylovoran biosynthesis glycosyltransferase